MRNHSLVAACLTATLAAAQPGFRTETVVQGLTAASAMAFAPDGRLFVLERTTGEILVVQDNSVAGVWATIPVDAPFQNSQGLMGIAVDPDFVRNGYIYVSVSQRAGFTDNVVMRLRDSNGAGVQPTIIGPSGILSSRIHNIGPMAFGGDGKLYVHTGDAEVGANAPKLSSPHGKVLRMNAPDGSIPSDNPHPGSWVWTSGHRNSFGLAVHPTTGKVYETENGDRAADEINLLEAGADYGWPRHEGPELVPDPTATDPIHVWAPPIAPVGACFYTGRLYPSSVWNGLIVGDWNRGQITLLRLDSSGTSVLGESLIYDYRRSVLGVANGPDGLLYTLYASTPGRGADRIDRLIWDPLPCPALALTAVSHVAVGGGMTVGSIGTPGEAAVCWIGFTSLTPAIPTPFGPLHVSIDVPLPSFTFAPSGRHFFGLAMPDDPSLVGATLHAQSASLDAGNNLQLGNPDSLLLH